MKLNLSNGTIQIDEEDLHKIQTNVWHIAKSGNRQYAITNIKNEKGKNTTTGLHRIIMNLKQGECCDHINHDGLDNRKQNLRKVTKHQNQLNRLKNVTQNQHPCTSTYKGVSWNKTKNLWTASISYNKKQIYIGWYKDETEAAQAYDKKAVELHGIYAYTNFGEQTQ